MAHGNEKFQEEFYLEAYEYARAGLQDVRIAELFQVTPQTFNSWKRDKPAFAKALARGRQPMTVNSAGEALSTTFKEYVYDRLDPQLQNIWDEIMQLEKPDADKSGWTVLKEMLDRGGYKMRQHLFMHALFHANFNVTEACRLVCITRKNFEYWMHTDPEFAALFRGVKEVKGDFFEEKLIGLVKQGDSAATIFANRTFNRDRGYNDKVEVQVNQTAANMITMDDIRDLDPEILRKVVEHIKNKRQLAQAKQNNIAGALPVHQVDEEVVTAEARHVK